MGNHKKLYRSKSNRMLAGVCGGISETYNMDATVIRLIWVFVSLLLGFGLGGLILYIIAAIIIPLDPGYTDI